ncbi:uncharacterized protein LOC130820807 [Amaranthus tricolor]|uniref:uncharacterized protein LOC130820807 n=1 Tax=Amaranthus tricolor TaxID=29722 RepID=UPI002586328C|nr:uncharacterized protein LOC130820807 [Amaranthus tricolor]
MAVSMTHLGPIFRTESGPCWYQTHAHELQTNYLEKRQLFLRSYQFSRKKSFREKIKRYLVRIKRLFSGRVRSFRKFRKVIWSELRFALYNKRRKLFKLLHQYYYLDNKNNYFCKNFNYQLFHRSNINYSSCIS